MECFELGFEILNFHILTYSTCLRNKNGENYKSKKKTDQYFLFGIAIHLVQRNREKRKEREREG